MSPYLLQHFKGKKVFLTGHTGFKGSWMLLLLKQLGAQVCAYALAPEQEDSLFNQIVSPALLEQSIIADIREEEKLKKAIVDFQPDYVFHLAAQALVRAAYADPITSYQVNTMGTAYVLEALRALSKPCKAVIITTDKVYENPEDGKAFLEEDKLGGYDPYSASKAAAEIVCASYTRSYFNPKHFDQHQKSIAVARAGNVIGGGDYAKDRIIPDIVKSIQQNQTLELRNPKAVRPWQHVLEPLVAYLLLAAKMNEDPIKYCSAFNFGPDIDDVKTVEELCQIFLEIFHKEPAYHMQKDANALHEAQYLILDATKAKTNLGWLPRLNATQAIQWTAQWYANTEQTALDKCNEQIKTYFNLA